MAELQEGEESSWAERPLDESHGSGRLTRRAVAMVLREGGRSWLVQASLGRPWQAILPRVVLKILD